MSRNWTRNWKRRLHIVGISPRSGTTILAELINHGFEIDGYVGRETNILHAPAGGPFEVLCTKKPNDISYIEPILDSDPDLWIICTVRDPRDVVVSRHGIDTSVYWTNLRVYREGYGAYERLRSHPRVLSMKYEEFVADPDAHQQRIADFLPFLKKRADFSGFTPSSSISKTYQRGMRNPRKIERSSVSAWQSNKPRLAGQISLHGKIDDMLINLGYESDSSWNEALAGIDPDTSASRYAEKLSGYRLLRRRLKRWLRVMRYKLGMFET